MWFAACLAWTFGPGGRRALVPFVVAAVVAFAGHFVAPQMLGLKTLAVNDYKGVAYARKFPDAKKVYESASPFGFLEVYSSSYLHFAPGLSDNAGFNLPTMPANAYLGLYIDGDGPIGVMRDLTDKETAYFRFLPMVYPYVIKSAPKTFIVQFGGGISTEVALHSGAKDVTVAEGNRAVLEAFHDDVIRNFTGDILSKVRVIGYEGRHFLAQTNERFDVIDLSLADSVGLSNPGGFAIVEKFSYTKEAMETYMRALAPGGVLSVTLWNKEEPPKSVLKLYATMAAAAREVDPAHHGQFLLRRLVLPLDGDGALQEWRFHPRRDREAARPHARHVVRRNLFARLLLRFVADRQHAGRLCRADFRRRRRRPAGRGARGDRRREPPRPIRTPTRPSLRQARRWRSAGHRDGPARLARARRRPLAGDRQRYVFNTRALTNDAPYFAAYVKTADLPRVLDRLELLQDEWGYLLIWATLGVACLTATVLLAIPLIWGWRTIFSRSRGKAPDRRLLRLSRRGLHHGRGRAHRPFRDGAGQSDHLGLGADHRHAGVLGPRRAGLGARLASHADGHAGSVRRRRGAADPLRVVSRPGARRDRRHPLCGAPPVLRFLLIAPPAFLMGFPMPIAMTTLGRLGKDHMFVWAWGVNGCFSVIGAAAAPVIATNFGLAAVIEIAGLAYLLAIPAFYGVIARDRVRDQDPVEARA